MRIGQAITFAVVLFHLPMALGEDSRLTEAIYRLSQEAAALWHTAPGFIGQETVEQRALVRRKRQFRIGVGAGAGEMPAMYENREISSWYALGAFKETPEALREFRAIYEVDGKSIAEQTAARSRLSAVIDSGDNAAKQLLLKEFEQRCVSGAATDFGQLILLFTRSNLDKYAFELGGPAQIGTNEALEIGFVQQAGKQSLHIQDGKRKSEEKLQGQIWVRQGDYLPLRIVVNSSREKDHIEIRDEASVDYTVVSSALLPLKLSYRHYLSREMVFESIHHYSGWQRSSHTAPPVVQP